MAQPGTGNQAGDGPRAQLQQLARQATDALGMEFVHLTYRKEGRRWLVRLFVDREDGVTLDDCAQASRQFSALLEVSDVIPHTYTLEVSSPGLDRPLHDEADYRRFTGREARLTTHRPLEGRRHFRGCITGCVQGQVHLQIEDGHDVVIPMDLIANGRLEVDLAAAE